MLGRQEVALAFGFVLDALRPVEVTRETEEPVPVDPSAASRLYRHLCAIVGELARNRRAHVVPLFPLLMMSLAKLLRPLQRAGFDSLAGTGKKAEREARSLFPPWAWSAGSTGFGAQEAGFLVATIKAVTVRTPRPRRTGLVTSKHEAPTTLVPALSKHAPFFMVAYLRACADGLAPLPLDVKDAFRPAVFEVMSAMGQHERGALMKSFLGKDDETERAMLKSLWRAWDRQRYKGED